jgi:hypothetical protein
MNTQWTPKIYTDNRIWIWMPDVGQCTAKRADGVLLAEATISDDGVVTTSHDGSELGKKYAGIICSALFAKTKLPSIMLEDTPFTYQ